MAYSKKIPLSILSTLLCVSLMSCSSEKTTEPNSSNKTASEISAPVATEAEIPEPATFETPSSVVTSESMDITGPAPSSIAPSMDISIPVLVPAPASKAASPDKKFHTVKVFYGTDRNKTNEKSLNDYFGEVRSTVSYGQIDISIPFNHKVGKIEAPSIWRLEFRENPEKHISMLALVEMDKATLFETVNKRLKDSGTNSAFIFFHGYNVTFSAAAKRTAQMAYDLQFPGIPFFYSWPSAGRVSAYTKDEGNIQWSEPHIKAFLNDIAKKSDIENIYLIAHSMGNRGLTRALGTLITEQPALKSKFKEVILAAPDIDADVFKRDILPKLTAQKLPITLYASADDKALIASKKVHGYSRAGDTGDSIIIAHGVETIDATGLDTGFLRHSYFSETQPMLKDIHALALEELRAHQRTLLEKVGDNGYWKFRETLQ
ncbi:MAG: Unknown protein [uncultured Thiotrichaceae bacterium]|uniref:Esterase/lipase superfamily enzyme n=1 Tax=uncultured Thiotrichaceae bacterium TaxID=298394 RepID=A0A6S6UHS5_9GAMM|nr:MAG: Unknown protein [uncultured Thiotrichaceae bacterium]